MQLERLQAIVGERGWSCDPDELEPYLTEWRGTWKGKTPLMLRPDSTEQVSRVVTECARQRIGIVPQGGNTGLCGGAIPDTSGSQILLSLERMNRVRSVSPDSYSLIAEAGCVLAELQQQAAAVGRLLPLSLAAEGSCQIGGNLSTDAGGINVLRYGTARAQVLGLEVVLPDGSVIDALRELHKDTAGYDVKQLFIGAEGTLGIITAAALRLYPVLPAVQTALFAVDSPQAALRLLALLREQCLDALQAFELISGRAMDMVCTHIAGAQNPLAAPSPWYALVEVASSASSDASEQVFQEALRQELASDAVVAKNDGEREALWRLRHSISAAQKHAGASLKHDVSVPIGQVGEFIETATRAIRDYNREARVVAFGHVGDGNVHFNVSQPVSWEAERFIADRDKVAGIVYDIVARCGGSFSAEHGVGLLKKEALVRYRSPAEVALMRRLKALLDPQNIMNPGKVL